MNCFKLCSFQINFWVGTAVSAAPDQPPLEFTFINQRIHGDSDSGLPPQISNEFKPFSRTLLPKPSCS
jgi:hypothetical protein